MYKLVDSESFFKKHGSAELQVSILDLASPTKGLVKVAADERISEFASKIQPKEDKSYLHINAMGAGEFYGSNRNGDYFPEPNLIKYCDTFRTSPAHLFRHHINKDPARANGKVIFVVYNSRMHRVELIVEADKSLVQDIEARIAKGDYPATSMACKTPYDTCSICGNQARSRAEYCVHLADNLNRIYPDGRRVMAINDGPLKFFDISLVVKPADVTSSVLVKVAGEDLAATSSAEAAELEGLQEFEKAGDLKKISELVKDLTDGHVIEAGMPLEKILSQVQDLPLQLARSLSLFEVEETLDALADLGISPSIAFLSEMIASKYAGKDFHGVGPLAELVFNEAHPDTPASPPDFSPSVQNPLATQALLQYVPWSSLLPEFVEKRASQVGYAGLGPRVEPTWEEEALAEQQFPKGFNPYNTAEAEGYLRRYLPFLLGLGASAVVAKTFISKQMEEKALEAELRAREIQDSNKGTKIVIIKEASDRKTAAHLSRAKVKADESILEGELASRVLKKVVKKTLKKSLKRSKLPGAKQARDMMDAQELYDTVQREYLNN